MYDTYVAVSNVEEQIVESCHLHHFIPTLNFQTAIAHVSIKLCYVHNVYSSNYKLCNADSELGSGKQVHCCLWS